MSQNVIALSFGRTGRSTSMATGNRALSTMRHPSSVRTSPAIPRVKTLAPVYSFPASPETCDLETGSRANGLGCAIAIRFALVSELVIGVAVYCVWRLLH